MTEQRHILLVNDLPGVGKVATAAMEPVLSHMGFSVALLPTALVSNTLDFGTFEILDTCEYMKKTADVWKKLDFRFDAICIGFINSPEQIGIIRELIENQRESLRFVIADTIMADEGKLYNGMTGKNVESMREMIRYADVITPNLTEALLLAGEDPEQYDSLSHREIGCVMRKLREFGARSVILTSCHVPSEDRYFVYGYDAGSRSVFRVPYELKGTRCPGTGDICSAVLTGGLMNGKTLEESTREAVRFMSGMFEYLGDREPGYMGFPIEAYLADLRQPLPR